ncbi:PREDICTED: transcription initiation factor TFIID subunit 7-like [Brassica oleracea var. oleracea]|uniref:transcription initiation factor TFIID subunit 7-like n=1 Tax=Brassica oleracea var. oleracea TaxID=109376 RepID=UPI0006A6EBB8|nr:PREDICTED: transcription initiation factor TFIID subunit 7-like [Brassica oleracea var. oleracea]
MRVLNGLLSQPGRERYTQVLSPTFEPGTTWFGRDKGRLSRKIRKICTNKFDDPFYSWSVVPTDDDNELFLKSTFTSKRGRPYGLGSLEDTLVNGKRKYAECSSSAFLDLQQQLAEAHRKIQKQAAYNSKLKRQQNKQTKHFSIMEKFLSANNPMYVEFKASNQDEEEDDDDDDEEEEDGDDDEDGEDDD